MSTFRAILPLPQPASEGSDGDGARPPPRKREVVSQACNACRKAKAKCNGMRPSCQTCLAKRKQCVYDPEDGRQTVAALQSRIQELEEEASHFRSAHQADSSEPWSRVQPGPDAPFPPTLASQPLGSTPQASLPSPLLTQEAIDSFFSCSGKLFHVFNNTQVSRLADSVWNGAENGSQSWKADVCCVMAVAAAGAQYANTTEDSSSADVFYHIAKRYLDELLETRPLDAIKVCTLLCFYNVMDKALTSLIYAEAGISLCRRFGLSNRHRGSSTLTDSMWVDYRRAWRTLIFLFNWLSASLGYKSGNQDFMMQISSSELNVDNVSDISEVVQTEMARIAVLKVKILHMHTIYKDLGWAVDAMVQDLEEWYEGLDPVLRLQGVPTQDLPLEVGRSIYLVHLLYLGANMLLFRRIAFQTLRLSNNHTLLPAPWQLSQHQYLQHADRALLAASSSAKIIKIMMDGNDVFKRCWIIIFQSYTSCLILLHDTTKKMALSTRHSTYEENLQNIQHCLKALDFCSSQDPVAARFHETLLPLYRSLMEKYANQPESPAMSNAGTGDQDPPNPEASYGPNQPLEKLSNDLLAMLCRPFGDPSNREESRKSLHVSYKTAPSRHEHQCLMEKLDWDFEDSAPFEWDPEMLGISANRIAQLNRYAADGETSGFFHSGPGAPVRSQFIDSSQPSGWASAAHLQMPPQNLSGADRSGASQ
ncbi:hypothetical protein ANO14919_120990 [Xylariales sp. No.14919]|nr:hypothetical protein ANO14919_120990 [Xylariales sp. No.14919]